MRNVPNRGDLIWLNFTPQSGHEQAGHRPAFVVSPLEYHEEASFVVVCPITSNLEPWPWKVFLPEEAPIGGAVLVDRVRSVDRRSRSLRVAGGAPESVLLEVQAKLAILFGIPS